MNITEARKTRVNRTNRIKAAKNIPTAILLKKKAECDAKALQIVKKLMEPAVEIKWMLNALGQINRTHLEDVAEERAIEKICGYVLCDNKLVKVVNKKYHISTLKNKVYDVEKMKNFCSFTCYSSMNHLMMQMLTSPLWLRNEEEIPTFTLLDKPTKRSESPPGIEINITGINLPVDIDNTRKEEKNESLRIGEVNSSNKNPMSSSRSKDERALSKRQVNTERILVDNDTKSKGTDKNEYDQESPEKDSNGTSSTSNKLIENSDADNKIDMKNFSNVNFYKKDKISEPNNSVINDKESTCTSQNFAEKKIVSRKQSEKRKSVQKPVIFTETLATRLERCFNEWVTKDTYTLLCNEKTDKDDRIKKIEFDDKYTGLCKKLDQLQFEDDDDEEQESSDVLENLKPTPHYTTLKHQAKELEIKVRAFYSGQLETEIPVNNSNEEENDTKSDTVIPLTDARAPNALRRGIFVNKLTKILPDVLRTLTGSNKTEYLYTAKHVSLVKAVISTFNLTAKNIVFRTAEWTLVSLLIIKMLGLIDPKIKASLSQKSTTMYLSMILMSYRLDSNYIDNLMNRFTISSEMSDIKDLESMDY